jgi:hypothetical protein
VQNRLLKQVEKSLQEGILDCRSALHSIGMEETVPAVVLDGSKALIVYMP